jgi:Skp family chaperone for outer membrane proteins
MDDFNITSITESKNEWCARFTNILTPCIIEGIKSIFMEADKICSETDEDEKYLMTFQNLLNNIPKWSSQIVETERERIINSSGCNYLEDLLTCIHITQLKALTISRVGIKQKKIDLQIPNLDTFIHKAYINVARKIYINVYLFQKDILPLEIQKNNRELELIIREAILNTVRDNIPIDNLLKIYLDETQETDVEIEETREVVPDEEEIKKRQEKQEAEKIETIKTEIKETLKKEQENSLNKALKNANTDLNKTQDDKLNERSSEIIQESHTIDNDEKIVINNNDISINDEKLNITNLSDDIDEINLDSLNIDTETNNIIDDTNDNIDDFELDIEQL